MGKSKGNDGKFQGRKHQGDSTKPKFDKKKWREKKYSKKLKVTEWEKKREKAIVKQYYKDLKNDPLYSHKLINQKPTKSSQEEADPDQTQQPGSSTTASPNIQQRRKKLNCYEAAKAEMQRIKEERDKQRVERAEGKKEMEQRLAEYKKKRSDRYRMLSKKNQRGQPVMKGRLEFLYQQIKQSVP